MAPVSGCTPRLFDMSASGTVNPHAFMLEVIDSERCAGIAAIPLRQKNAETSPRKYKSHPSDLVHTSDHGGGDGAV